MCIWKNIYTFNFCCTNSRRSAFQFNFFWPTLGSEILFSVVFAGIQKMQCACRLFFAFFYAGAHALIICSFALMQKNQKIKALMPSLKMVCTALKCKNSLRSNSLHFLTLRFVHFFNAHPSRPMCVL